LSGQLFHISRFFDFQQASKIGKAKYTNRDIFITAVSQCQDHDNESSPVARIQQKCAAKDFDGELA
jgi:hypothetical protein